MQESRARRCINSVRETTRNLKAKRRKEEEGKPTKRTGGEKEDLRGGSKNIENAPLFSGEARARARAHTREAIEHARERGGGDAGEEGGKIETERERERERPGAEARERENSWSGSCLRAV